MDMQIADTSTPVVVLKLEHYGSLGIMRSLGRLGIPVYGVDAAPHTPACSSRYCAGFFPWNLDTAPGQASVEFLLHVGRTLGHHPLLIPTSDETTRLIANSAVTLQEVFRFPGQSPELIQALCSKKTMFFLARHCGIPTAQAVFPRSRADVLAWLATATFPVMLKGIDGGELERRTGKKMLIIQSPEALLRAYDEMEDPTAPNLMLQEYIPGPDDAVWMCNAYFDARSDCLVAFTGKKLRQNPVYTGMTSLGVCLRNERVRELTIAFMRHVGYRGVLDIGYRYDARDRQYKVLDVNPRIGATFRLFVADNGLDVVRALYLDMTGQPVYGEAVREGRKWMVEDKDLLSSYRYYRDGCLTVGAWVRSLWGVEEAGYWAWDDRRPFLRMWSQHLRRSVGRWVIQRQLRTASQCGPQGSGEPITVRQRPVQWRKRGVLALDESEGGYQS